MNVPFWWCSDYFCNSYNKRESLPPRSTHRTQIAFHTEVIANIFDYYNYHEHTDVLNFWYLKPYRNIHTPHSTVGALRPALFTCRNILDNFTQTLVSSMLHRIFEVINKNDEGTHYRILFIHCLPRFKLFLVLWFKNFTQAKLC